MLSVIDALEQRQETHALDARVVGTYTTRIVLKPARRTSVLLESANGDVNVSNLLLACLVVDAGVQAQQTLSRAASIVSFKLVNLDKSVLDAEMESF